MNKIMWHKRAKKQLAKIPEKPRVKLFYATGELVNFPDCTNIKRLNNHSYDYRLRIGNYRVLFDFDGKIKIIAIQEVKKRDEQTY